MKTIVQPSSVSRTLQPPRLGPRDQQGQRVALTLQTPRAQKNPFRHDRNGFLDFFEVVITQLLQPGLHERKICPVFLCGTSQYHRSAQTKYGLYRCPRFHLGDA